MFGELNNNIGKTESNSKSKVGDCVKLKHTFTSPDSDDFDSSAPGSNNTDGGMTPGDFLSTPAMLGISQSGGGTKRLNLIKSIENNSGPNVGCTREHSKQLLLNDVHSLQLNEIIRIQQPSTIFQFHGIRG